MPSILGLRTPITNFLIESFMTYSGIYQSGIAKTSDLLEANLSVDIAIIGTTEYWAEKGDNFFEETVTSEYASTFFDQVIAFTQLGEIGLEWWPNHPNREERLSWDQNVDGLPDDGAPSWLGPVNLDWKVPVPKKSNPYYQRQYPLYMVRFWEDDFLKYIKEEILFYQEKGWDGIYFDTVPPTGWTKDNEVHSSIYTWDELADHCYSGLKKLHDFTNSTSHDFKIFINGSVLNQWIHYRPEALNLLDGIVIEKAFFRDYEFTEGTKNHPSHYEFQHWNENADWQDILLVMDRQGVDIPVILTEYVDDSPEIAAANAISLNQLGHKVAAHSVYDELFRSKQNPSKRTLSQNYVSYVGEDGNDHISNTSNTRSILVGRDGDDTLIGSNLDDILMGGSGNNLLKGGDGFDIAVYDDPYEAYTISGDSIVQKVELKNQYRHQLKITLQSWTVPDKTPKFSLFVNGSLVENEMSITPGKEQTFRYWSATPINSIQYLNTNGAYYPEYKSAVVTQIQQILVNDQQVTLADAAFLDGKEEWAGYNSNDTLKAGYGNVYFDTSIVSSHHAGVNDELHSVEQIMFSGESISSRAAHDDSDFFYIKDLNSYDGIIESVKGKGKLKGTRAADAFTFDSFESFTKKTADKIIGFDASQGDRIAFNSVAFPGLEGSSEISFASTKIKKEFKQLSKEDYDFVYFEKRGFLYFDGNDSGKMWGNKNEGGLFAILQGKPDLTVNDFKLLV